mmetsp:Transcript_23616/g.36432  ORF Transcript_23616/g.36432 Transcript_23616/m.36432 type:complete len:264 (+) Transcript_23616:429-1220(+)
MKTILHKLLILQTNNPARSGGLNDAMIRLRSTSTLQSVTLNAVVGALKHLNLDTERFLAHILGPDHHLNLIDVVGDVPRADGSTAAHGAASLNQLFLLGGGSLPQLLGIGQQLRSVLRFGHEHATNNGKLQVLGCANFQSRGQLFERQGGLEGRQRSVLVVDLHGVHVTDGSHPQLSHGVQGTAIGFDKVLCAVGPLRHFIRFHGLGALDGLPGRFDGEDVHVLLLAARRRRGVAEVGRPCGGIDFILRGRRFQCSSVLLTVH